MFAVFTGESSSTMEFAADEAMQRFHKWRDKNTGVHIHSFTTNTSSAMCYDPVSETNSEWFTYTLTIRID